MVPAYDSLELVTWACTKYHDDLLWANVSATYVAELQANVVALEEYINNPTENRL